MSHEHNVAVTWTADGCHMHITSTPQFQTRLEAEHVNHIKYLTQYKSMIIIILTSQLVVY